MQNDASDAFAVWLRRRDGRRYGPTNRKMDERHGGGRAKGRGVNFKGAEDKKRGIIGGGWMEGGASQFRT